MLSDLHTASANPTNSQHHAVTRHKDPLSTSNNEFLTVSIVDGFGQAIQLKKKHVANGNEVWQVSGKETKDAFGRVIESYLPTVQGYSPSNFAYDNNVPGSSLPAVVMDYDERDRQIKIQQPNEQNYTAISYAIEDQMLVTKVVNELSQTRDTYTDTRGRQRKVVQNDEITTEFYYNCIDELVGVKNQGQYET